jgi:dienelactone hydrolase
MKPRKLFLIMMLVSALLLLVACGTQPADQNAPVENSGESQPQNTASNSQDEPAANNMDNQGDTQNDTEPEPMTEPTEPPYDALPPERQPVDILTSDGRLLEGFYYPAKTSKAPVVVLMHWARGTMDDWEEIAPWLQNRQDELAGLPDSKDFSGLLLQTSGMPYLDPSWFPPMPEEASFAVLIFNFGDFGNSPFGSSPESWVDDALSALNFAAGLDEVDPHRIAALGASIGSDGAVDACYLMNTTSNIGSCVGAMSFSPGNYLTEEFTYKDAAASIDLDGYPVWCLAAEDDYSSPEICRSLDGTYSESFIYTGGEHGMMLVTPELTPIEPLLDLNAMQLIQAWLDAVYDTSLEDLFN